MGIGGGSLAGQNQQLISSLLSQLSGFNSSQAAQAALVPGQNAATIAQYNQLTQQMLGETPAQQEKAVKLGQLDYIKTSPGGLLNAPKTATMGLL